MITYYLSCALIAILIPLVFIFLHKSHAKEGTESTLRPPKFYLYTGIVGFVAFPLFYFLAYQQQQDGDKNIPALIFVSVFYGILCIAALYLILFSSNWRLHLTEHEFTYINWLGVKSTFHYSDITKVVFYYKKQPSIAEKCIIYVDKRTISIDKYIANPDEFRRVMKRKLKNEKSTAPILFLQKSK